MAHAVLAYISGMLTKNPPVIQQHLKDMVLDCMSVRRTPRESPTSVLP